MNSALHAILTDMPRAAAIWLVLLAVAFVAVVAHPAAGKLRSAGFREAEPVDQALLADDDPRADDRRYAEEIALVVERAAVTATRRRADWEAAERAVEAAWAAFDAADRAACRARAAAAFPVGCPLEDAECERYLHRAATAACRRKELAVAELNEVLAHRGWDPRRHPVEQEVALRQLVRDSALRAYLDAAERERRAWHAADVSAAAVRSLRDEAFEVRQRVEAAEADGATAWLDDQLGRDQLTVGLPMSPQLVAH